MAKADTKDKSADAPPATDPRELAVRVQVSHLRDGLKDIAAVVRGGEIPILGNVLIESANGMLHLTANDMNVWARRAVEIDKSAAEAKDYRSFTVTLPAKPLAAVLAELDGEATVLIEVNPLSSRAQLNCGRSKFKLPTLPAVDFPVAPVFATESVFEIAASVLADALNAVDHAISTEETRYYLNGIYLHPHGLELRMATTDGHRLCRLSIDGPDGAASFASVIVPKGTVSLVEGLLSRHLKSGDDPAPVLIESDGSNTGRLRFEIGETEIISRMIDGEFPDYTRVIPLDPPQSASIDKAALAGAIRRVAALASKESRAVKAAFATDRLTLSMNSPENGEASEELAIQFDGVSTEIGFNSKYWLDALAAIGSDTVTMRFADPTAPVKLTPFGEDERFVQVLMPVRI